MKARRLVLVTVAATCAAMFGVLSLAPLDLVSGLLPVGRDAATSSAIGDVAFGVLGLVLIAPAFAALARREGAAAALHQLALVVVVLAAASVWSGESGGVLGAAAVAVALAIVWALHPDRRSLLPQPAGASWSPAMVALAVAVSVPAWWYAAALAARGRADLPPEDSFAFVPSLWSAVVAVLVSMSLLALLAASRESGWLVPAACVGVAVLLLGLASVVNPDVPASGGRGWGVAAIAWSGAWLLAARSANRPATPAWRRPGRGPARSGRTPG